MTKISRQRVNNLLKSFSRQKTLILGDLMVDKYVWGIGIRLSSEAPVPVIRVDREEYRLGGAANIAYHSSNLGAQTNVCGIVGYDDAAYHLRTEIIKSGIPAGGVFPSESRPTTQKVRIMSVEHSQLLGRFDYETTIPLTESEEASVRQYLVTFSDDLDILVLSDHGKGILRSETITGFISSLKKDNNILIIGQARTSDLEILSGVDYLIASYSMVQSYFNQSTRKGIGDFEEMGNSIVKSLNLPNLVVYDNSEQRITLFRKDQSTISNVIDNVCILDQTGLGDITTAIISLALSTDATPEESLILAHRGAIAAGLQIGTGKITRENLKN